jgi:hypothetical protein
LGLESKVTRISAGTGNVTALGQGNWRQFTVDGAGNLFVATDHDLLRIPAAGGPATKVGDVGFFLEALAADWAGNVYVADYDFDTGGRVVKIPADGTPPGAVWTGASPPWAIAVDGHQDLYVYLPPPPTVVKVRHVGGSTSVVTQLPNTAEFWVASAVAVDPQGNNVYLGSATIQPDQTVRYSLIRQPTGGGPATILAIDPTGSAELAADAAGFVYAVDWVNERVVMIDSNSGQQTTVIEVANPQAVAVRPVRARPRFTLPDLVGKLFGAAAADGDGWLLIGDHFVPIPPRSPELAAILHAAVRNRGRAMHNPELAERVRNAGTPERQ